MLASFQQLTDLVASERLKSKKNTDFWRTAYLDLCEKHPCDHSMLSKSYRALLQALIGGRADLDPEMTNAGAPLNNGLCHPLFGKDLSTLWQLTAQLTHDKQLDEKSIKATQFIGSLCDQWQRPFSGLWIKEGDAKNHIPSAPLHALLKPIKLAPASIQSDPELGFALHHGARHSMAFTATGDKCGCASIMSDDVGIITMGPQRMPFDDPTQFGIHFSPNDAHPLHEHKPLPGVICKQKPHFFYAGWSRIISNDNHLWMHTEASLQKTLDLNVQFLDLRGNEMAICMAVKADAVRTHDLELIKGSLKTYQGPAGALTLEGKRGQMVIIKEGDDMHVQPLAGDESYWGADFLIRYPFGISTKMSWNIY